MKIIILISSLFLSACVSKASYKVSQKEIKPGTEVSVKGKKLKLFDKTKPIKTGESISKFTKGIANPEEFEGQVTLINVVPSVDTTVCEEQTHILGESKKIHPSVKRVSISRDLPMAQARFAKEAKLENITYYSDFKEAAFGKESGLLIIDNGLLARGVMVVDKEGVIRYMQFVPELTELPNMDKAIAVANDLAKKK